MFSSSLEEIVNLQWKPVIEELRSLSRDSEYAVVVSFIAQRDLIEGALSLSKLLGQKMLLIAENAEDFLYPYDPPFDVIVKEKISSIDPDRNLHAKIFLFGRRLSPKLHILRCLVGSPNATISGCCRNVEFWATSEAHMDFSKSPEKSLLGLFKNDNIDPSLIPLAKLCKHKENDMVLPPLVDLLWRLVRNSRGFDAGLDPGKSECLADRLVDSNQFRAIFVHTLGDNSLWKAVKSIVHSAIETADENCVLEIVSPYHNWRGLANLLTICRESLKRYNQSVRIQLLTAFPPHFPNMYLTEESFEDLDRMKPKDKRIEFNYRVWTKSSEIEVSKLLNDESLQDLSRVFLHGKVLIASNDKGECQALLGSSNITGAAITHDPKVNLECGIWEKDTSRAENLRRAVRILWESARVLDRKLREQLNDWQETLSEDVGSLSGWNENVESYADRFKKKSLETMSLYLIACCI